MASMTAKAYLIKVNEICKTEDATGRCQTKDCPLHPDHGLGCGVPNENKINSVIDIVKSYKIIETGKCPGCGRDNTALIDRQDIKFCPYCGQSIRAEKNNN